MGCKGEGGWGGGARARERARWQPTAGEALNEGEVERGRGL